MSWFDLGFVAGSILFGIAVIIWSPYYRAIVVECAMHPLSNGWIDCDDTGVHVHRGETLSEYLLSDALDELRASQQATERAERERVAVQGMSAQKTPSATP